MVFGYHELFHAFTLAGVACQYVAIAFFVIRAGQRPGSAGAYVRTVLGTAVLGGGGSRAELPLHDGEDCSDPSQSERRDGLRKSEPRREVGGHGEDRVCWFPVEAGVEDAGEATGRR